MLLYCLTVWCHPLDGYILWCHVILVHAIGGYIMSRFEVVWCLCRLVSLFSDVVLCRIALSLYHRIGSSAVSFRVICSYW